MKKEQLIGCSILWLGSIEVLLWLVLLRLSRIADRLVVVGLLLTVGLLLAGVWLSRLLSRKVVSVTYVGRFVLLTVGVLCRSTFTFCVAVSL